MSKALYREYRPKSLDEVVGQDHITKNLRNALKKGVISHAYLLTGPRGVGKTSVARILAFEINGIPYDEETTNLDIIEIDAASNRRIDEIRDLREKANILPVSLKYKVYIIDEVHMLTREAFNALLKTLEEPPQHVIFILATTEVHKLPETIVSRTQRYSFKPISEDYATQHLRKIADSEKIKITDEALKLIADHGGGSFRDSISMLDQMSALDSKEVTGKEIAQLLGIPDDHLIDNLIKALNEDNSGQIFDNMQKLKEQGSNPSTISQTIIKRLRDDMVESKGLLTPARAVKLMKDLLPLSSTYSSYEAIEIVFLDNLEISNNRVDKTASGHTETEPNTKTFEEKVSTVEVEPSVIIEETGDIPTTEGVETEVIAASNPSDSWEGVLNILKSSHNTLYGVLRMADAEVEDNKIILTFKFEFHKKQLDQSKNMTALKTVIDQQLGKDFQIHSKVKKPAKPEISQKKADDSKTLEDISNIFGGAELLES